VLFRSHEAQSIRGFVPRPTVPTQIVFLTDTDGDEHMQLTLLDVSTGFRQSITRDPRRYHHFGAFAQSGSSLSYTMINEDLSPHTVTVMIHHIAMGVSFSIRTFVDPVGVSVGPFTPDEQNVLVAVASKTIPSDEDLYLLDITGREAPRLLTEHSETNECQFVVGSAKFHPQQKDILFILSNEADFNDLWTINVRTLERKRVLWFENQDIISLTFTPDMTLAGIVTNNRGFGTFHLYRLGGVDGLTFEELPSRIPTESRLMATPLILSDDGSSILYSHETLRDSSEIRLITLSSGSTPALAITVPLPLPDILQKLPEPVDDDYTSGELKIPAFDFAPAPGSVREGEKAPYMIVIHGGPKASAGPKLDSRVTSIPLHFLRTKGVGVFVPNIRGSIGFGKRYSLLDNRSKRFDAVGDVLAAIDHIKRTKGADRIGVIGGSYGGWMTLQVASVASNSIGVAIDMFGISDFRTFLKNTAPHRRRDRALEYGDDPTLIAKLSPAARACDIKAPLLVIQGANDIRVPLSESKQMVDKVRECGGVVEGMFIEGEGHGFVKDQSKQDVVSGIIRFLSKTMLKKELQGICDA